MTSVRERKAWAKIMRGSVILPSRYVQALQRVAEAAKPFAQHGGHTTPEEHWSDLRTLRKALSELEATER